MSSMKNELLTVLEYLTKQISENPKIQDNYRRRGMGFMKLGRHKEAILDFSKVMEINPDELYSSDYIFRGYSHLALNMYKEAIDDLTEAEKMDPNLPTIMVDRGNAYLRLGQFDKALEDYTKAIKIEPKVSRGYFERGSLCMYLKRYQQAIDDLTNSLKYEDGGEEACSLSKRGCTYNHLHLYEEGLKDCKEAVKHDSEFVNPYAHMGNSYRGMKRYDESRKCFEKAMELDPTYPGTYFYRGLLSIDLKRFEEAETDIRKSIELIPNKYEVADVALRMLIDYKERVKYLWESWKSGNKKVIILSNPKIGVYKRICVGKIFWE